MGKSQPKGRGRKSSCLETAHIVREVRSVRGYVPHWQLPLMMWDAARPPAAPQDQIAVSPSVPPPILVALAQEGRRCLRARGLLACMVRPEVYRQERRREGLSRRTRQGDGRKAEPTAPRTPPSGARAPSLSRARPPSAAPHPRAKYRAFPRCPSVVTGRDNCRLREVCNYLGCHCARTMASSFACIADLGFLASR